jgi:hypothetical protein
MRRRIQRQRPKWEGTHGHVQHGVAGADGGGCPPLCAYGERGTQRGRLLSRDLGTGR